MGQNLGLVSTSELFCPCLCYLVTRNDQNNVPVLLKVACVQPDLPSDPFGLEVHPVPAELTLGSLQGTNSIASQKKERNE